MVVCIFSLASLLAYFSLASSFSITSISSSSRQAFGLPSVPSFCLVATAAAVQQMRALCAGQDKTGLQEGISWPGRDLKPEQWDELLPRTELHIRSHIHKMFMFIFLLPDRQTNWREDILVLISWSDQAWGEEKTIEPLLRPSWWRSSST